MGIEVTRAGDTPAARINCCRIASPVVTISAVALAYSQRVAAPVGMRAEMWRVRTNAGGRRLPSQNARQASAASQLSVELWLLTTSTRSLASTRRNATRPASVLRPIGKAMTGTLNRSASSKIGALRGAASRTS